MKSLTFVKIHLVTLIRELFNSRRKKIDAAFRIFFLSICRWISRSTQILSTYFFFSWTRQAKNIFTKTICTYCFIWVSHQKIFTLWSKSFNTFQELSAELLDQKLTCGTACQHILSLHNSCHIKLANCLASDHFTDAKNSKSARTWFSENRDKQVYCGNHFRKPHATKSIMGTNLYCMIIIYLKTALQSSTLCQ